MLISKTYYTLIIFHIASLSMNNCFNAPGNGCVQILHCHHKYEMAFSFVEILQHFKIKYILTNSSLLALFTVNDLSVSALS